MAPVASRLSPRCLAAATALLLAVPALAAVAAPERSLGLALHWAP